MITTSSTPTPRSGGRTAAGHVSGHIERDRLIAVLDAVVADDVLTRQQADVILQRVAVGDSAVDKAAPDRRGRLAEIAGYLGGALALSAAALFLGTEWSDLEDATRAAFLLVAGAVLVAGGVAIVIGSGLGPDGLGR